MAAARPGLVAVAAATAVVVPAVRPGPGAGVPRAAPSRADRVAALLGDADHPGEYEIEPFGDDGADAFEPADAPGGFGPACDGLGAPVPAFPGDHAGAATVPRVPPGRYEDTNWASTDYVEAVAAARNATWDPARAAALLDGCDTATTQDGTLTVRRLDPPVSGAVTARVTYRQSDGVRVEQASAVVPVGGQLAVLVAGRREGRGPAEVGAGFGVGGAETPSLRNSNHAAEAANGRATGPGITVLNGSEPVSERHGARPRRDRRDHLWAVRSPPRRPFGRMAVGRA